MGRKNKSKKKRKALLNKDEKKQLDDDIKFLDEQIKKNKLLYQEKDQQDAKDFILYCKTIAKCHLTVSDMKERILKDEKHPLYMSFKNLEDVMKQYVKLDKVLFSYARAAEKIPLELITSSRYLDNEQKKTIFQKLNNIQETKK